VERSGDLKMPPGGALPESAVRDLREWVNQGAVYPAAASATNSVID